MMGCQCCLLAVSLLILWNRASGVYVFKGNPYEQTDALGVGNLDLSKDGDGVPIHTKVVYPIDPGEYTPILFIPGLNGVVYPEVYSTVSARIASFGYVLIEVDLYWPAEDTFLNEQSIAGLNKPSEPFLEDVDNLKRNPELAFKVLNWLKDNLLQRLLPNAGSPNVTVDWSRVGLLSHSLGADTIIRMLQQNNTFSKAVIFLDPGSSNFKSPLNYSIPSLMVGTQLCMEFPACCIKGLSYYHFYSNLQCPKIVMNVTNFGHCSVIDEIAWDVCHLVHVCKTNETSKRNIFRNVFIPGVLASFFGSYLQGNSVLLKYATTPDLVPLPLGQLEYNVTCA